MKVKEIMRFLMGKIPIVLDMDKQDLKFDTNNMYYKTYRYIYKLKEENTNLKKGGKKEQILF